MSARIQNINAILQFTPNDESPWGDDLSVPVPLGVWTYDTVEYIIKVGNGLDLFNDLKVHIDLKTIQKISEVYKVQMPKPLLGKLERLLVVNEKGTGYKLSDVKISEYLTALSIKPKLDEYSDKRHKHPNYYTKSELNNLIREKSAFGKEENDILSSMLLDYMGDKKLPVHYTNLGYADSFLNLDRIDTSNSTKYTHTGGTRLDFGNGTKVQSTVYKAKEDIVSAYVGLHLRTKNVHFNRGFTLELSRDGGKSWANCHMEYSGVENKDVIYYHSGMCNFDSLVKNVTLPLSSFVIEDIKKDNLRFIVDVDNSKGHFEIPKNEQIVPGTTMRINGDKVGILEIVGDGSLDKNVTFKSDVDLPIGVYEISMIYGVEIKDDKLVRTTVKKDDGSEVTWVGSSLNTLAHIDLNMGDENIAYDILPDGGSNLFYLFNDRDNYFTVIGNVKRDVVRFRHSWEFKHPTNGWVVATSNRREDAIREAIVHTYNKMTLAQVKAVQGQHYNHIKGLTTIFRPINKTMTLNKLNVLGREEKTFDSGNELVFRIKQDNMPFRIAVDQIVIRL